MKSGDAQELVVKCYEYARVKTVLSSVS